MKVTHNWLKRYVDCDSTPDELAEQLTMIGLEVEGAENVSGGFDGIVVAEVLSKEPHPGADRLSLCKVSDGDGERQSQDEDRAFHLGGFPGGLIDVDEVFREMSFSMA